MVILTSIGIYGVKIGKVAGNGYLHIKVLVYLFGNSF